MNIKSATFVKGITGTDKALDDEYPQIAFIGRSNSGKSSLINSLTNQKGLARTSALPGRTQMINLFLINRNTYFLDLPGYGFAKVPKKNREWFQQIIQWYLFTSGYRQKKVVLILDANVGPTDKDIEMLQQLEKYGKSVLIAANKVDKIRKSEYNKKMAHIQELIGEHTIIAYSTPQRIGVKELTQELLR